MSNEKRSIDRCPVCGSLPDVRRVRDFYPCDCGTLFRPEISDETIETHSGDWAASREEVRNRFFESARKKISYVNDYLDESDRLLEIGIGTGELLIVANRAGLTPVGVDANRDVCEYCRDNLPGIEVHQGYLQEIGFDDDSFDAVMMSHLFEHVPEPDAFLQELDRILAPDGVGYIGTPNAAAYAPTPIRSQFGGLTVLDHKVLYTPATLERTLCRNGFSDVRTRTTIAGFDIPNAIRSWIIEQLGIRTRDDRVENEGSSPADSADRDSSGSLSWRFLRRLNSAYSRFVHRFASAFDIIFHPYHEWLRRNGVAPMLHCIFRR
jgi:SAM-dependent methyltransferase